jgi:hypothetical protein
MEKPIYDDSEQAVVSRLELNVLLPFKRKYLGLTDNVSPNSVDEENQDVENVLGKVEKNMSELHSVLTTIIKETVGTLQGGGTNVSIGSIRELLEQERILAPLRANHALKEPLIRCVDLHLKEYPYSSGKHAHTLHNSAVLSYGEIIPNTV